MNTKIKNIHIRPISTTDGQTMLGPLLAGLNEIIRKPVSPKTGLKIRRIVRVVNQQAEDVDAERVRLLEKYAKKGDDGKPLHRDEANEQIDLADEAGFLQEFQELLNLDFEVEALTAGELEQIGNVSTLTLMNLGDLIVDEEPHTNGNTPKPQPVQKRVAKRRR